MEEFKIVWEYPNSLPEPYKSWAERIICDHIHPQVFPVPESYTSLKLLIMNAKLGDVPSDFKEKFEGYVSDINRWLDESSDRTADSPPRQFTDFDELLPHFEEYFIHDRAEGEGASLILLDVIGKYKSRDYNLGRLVFIQKDGTDLLHFYADFQDSWKVHSLIYEKHFKLGMRSQSGTEEPLVYNSMTGEIIV